MIIKLLKRLFCPARYYSNRIEAIKNRFDAECEKNELLASFAKWLIPIHQRFEKNAIEDRWVIVDRHQFAEVYKMGITYFMGMRIFWN